MAKWLDKYNDGGPVQPNYNDAKASTGPGYVGTGYDTTGRNYSPAWGGQFENGGDILGKRFLQPNDPKLPKGWNPEAKGYSTEYSTTVGKDGQYYLVPGFKNGKLVSDPEREFNKTGELLGGPFKTIQSAQNFADRRHKYVEQGKPVPSPLKTYDAFQNGGKTYKSKPMAQSSDVKSVSNTFNADDFSNYSTIINKYPNMSNDTSYMYARNTPTGTEQFFHNTNQGKPVSQLQRGNEFVNLSPEQVNAYKQKVLTGTGGFAMGGSIPGAVGFTYARTVGAAPANGKYTKKTKASAQNGKEMSFYQQGLDWKPNNISRDGSVIKDDRGQWAHPGEITQINSNDITMQGVDYPVLGVSDTGDTQMMQPGEDYKFDGEKVTEYPMAQNGDWLSKYDNIPSGNNLKKQAEETIARRNANRPTMSQYTPKEGEQAKFDKQKLQRIAEENAPLNRMAASQGAENMQDAIEAAMIMEGGLLAGKLVAKGIPKVTRAGLNAIDKNFSKVGKELVRIEKEGIKKGLSPEAIKEKQLQKVGITSSQREAYVPGVSDALEKYIYPQGYGGGGGESKLAQTVKAIKTGTREKAMPSREDAWSLYLGKPQTSNTFRMAETNPINHPAYTPEQLSKMDIYSINDEAMHNGMVYSNLEGIGPRAVDETTLGSPEQIISILEKNSEMVTDPISYGYHFPVMGGYNKRLNQYGLEYNDIWDLEPELFGKKIKIDNFIGKPFMSHEVLPDITSEKVKSLVTSQVKSADALFKPSIEWYKDLMDKGSMIDYSQTLEGYKSALNKVNELKGKLGIDQDIMMNSNGWGTKDWNNTINNTSIKKQKDGGWLNKYK